MRRIGMLTSGGGCQTLNATVRGVAKSLYNMFDDVEIIGLKDGYKGFMYVDYQIMKSSDFSGIFTRGGIVLGTFRQSFKLMRTPDENGPGKVETMKHTYKKLKLSCLVVLGGNGSQKTANTFGGKGLNTVSLPKTASNDLWGTDTILRSQSTVDVTTNAIDYIHTMVVFRGCVFIVEVMGHKVGWLTLYAGLAGGADIIFPPEIPYDINTVCDVLTKRSKAGKRFFILAVTEGVISRKDAKMSKKELKERKKSGVAYPSVAYEIGAKIQEVISNEVRVMIPGHMQRGGEPCAYDRVLAIRLGAAAARLIAEERYGYVVAVKNNDITQVPLPEAAGRLKTMDSECFMTKEVRMVGISSGDE